MWVDRIGSLRSCQLHSQSQRHYHSTETARGSADAPFGEELEKQDCESNADDESLYVPKASTVGVISVCRKTCFWNRGTRHLEDMYQLRFLALQLATEWQDIYLSELPTMRRPWHCGCSKQLFLQRTAMRLTSSGMALSIESCFKKRGVRLTSCSFLNERDFISRFYSFVQKCCFRIAGEFWFDRKPVILNFF